MNTSLKKELSKKKIYNFLINASNQANLSDLNHSSAIQINSLLIFIDPYVIDKYIIEDEIDLEFNLNDNDTITINNKTFDLVEIKPGVKVFAVLKNTQE